MAERLKYKRTQYFVARRFQLKYVGVILLFMFFTAALCSYVVYYTSMISLGEKLANVYPQGRLVSIVRMVNLRILISIILVTPLVAFIAVLLSHRIAGPIFRMERFLNNIAAGDLSGKIVLREGDELTNLADGMNNIVEIENAIVRNQKERLIRMTNTIANLKKAMSAMPQDMPGINLSLSKIEEDLRATSVELDKYKLEKSI